MRSRRILVAAALIVCLVGISGACKKKPPVPTPGPPTTESKRAPEPPKEPIKEVTEAFPKEPVEAETPAEPGVDELNRRKPLATVYFDYDSSDLSDATRATLQANASWLQTNKKRSIRIEGHCDERGTIKYNLALGERRANAVRDYLQSLGIEPSRMRIVTYGEERPVDLGHGEDAWRLNRRGEFWIES